MAEPRKSQKGKGAAVASPANTYKLRMRKLTNDEKMKVFCGPELDNLEQLIALEARAMATGMEKEEEQEEHLKKALEAQKSGLPAVPIPIPKVWTIEEDRYGRTYPAQHPRPHDTYITNPDSDDDVHDAYDYDADSDDEKWLNNQNLLEIEQFESIMGLLIDTNVEDLSSLPDAARLHLDKFSQNDVENVHGYWMQKKSRPGTIIVTRHNTQILANHDPYKCFRPCLEKRKRGRPPRSSLPANIVSNPSSLGRRSTRRKSVFPSTSFIGSQNEMFKTPKRKVGRPPKKQSLAEMPDEVANNVSSEPNVNQQPTRRVGRPPKNLSVVGMAETNNQPPVSSSASSRDTRMANRAGMRTRYFPSLNESLEQATGLSSRSSQGENSPQEPRRKRGRPFGSVRRAMLTDIGNRASDVVSTANSESTIGSESKPDVPDNADDVDHGLFDAWEKEGYFAFTRRRGCNYRAARVTASMDVFRQNSSSEKNLLDSGPGPAANRSGRSTDDLHVWSCRVGRGGRTIYSCPRGEVNGRSLPRSSKIFDPFDDVVAESPSHLVKELQWTSYNSSRAAPFVNRDGHNLNETELPMD